MIALLLALDVAVATPGVSPQIGGTSIHGSLSGALPMPARGGGTSHGSASASLTVTCTVSPTATIAADGTVRASNGVTYVVTRETVDDVETIVVVF